MSGAFLEEDDSGEIILEEEIGAILLEDELPLVTPPQTLLAPPLDVAGQLLDEGVAVMQAVLNNWPDPSQQSAMQQQLNALQVQEVDHYMATYWGSADSILAALPPSTANRHGKHVAAVLAAIAQRAAAVATLVAQGLPTITLGNEAPQYSIAYLPYQVPDTYWYQLNTQLVDFCMAYGILPASEILSTLVGNQTYPFNYTSNYTYYQTDIEG
jgi:hypothetical protein